MPAKNTSRFILLSELTNILKEKEYYQTFAKTIAMTSNSKNPMTADDELVAEMFLYFIQTNLLHIYHENALVDLGYIELEIDKRVSKSIEAKDFTENTESTIRNSIWKDEVYIEIKELKKLYANKCIVFPSSLLTEISKR